MSKTKPRRETTAKKQNGNSNGALASSVSTDIIAQRAYALYLARGTGDGNDLTDWLQAERELLKETAPTPSKTRKKTN